jgi:hypothetical protein
MQGERNGMFPDQFGKQQEQYLKREREKMNDSV